MVLFLRNTGIDSSLTLYLPSITDWKDSMSGSSLYIDSGNIFKARSLSLYPIVSFGIHDVAFCCTFSISFFSDLEGYHTCAAYEMTGTR